MEDFNIYGRSAWENKSTAFLETYFASTISDYLLETGAL